MTGSGSEETMTGFQLEDAIEILERRRWWILLAAMSGLVIGFLSYLVVPAKYQSHTTILVEPQGAPEAYIKSTVTLAVERLTRMLGIPVFASIPRIDNDQIFETPPNSDVDPKVVAYTAPESSPAEQYRGFLPTFLEAEDCKVILVTSAARGDGKTITTMNLAVTLATDLNKRVLVIDGDLRRPNVHRVMRVDRRMGLSTVLRQETALSECTVNSKIHNVTVLPAGGSVRNPLALLTDSKFLEVIEEAKTQYDIVLIDSPPLLPVVDSKILRKMADMVLFVVRADSTPREAVVRSMKDMRDVAGVIFNQVSPGSFRRYYYHDAYSRYAYGDPIADDADEMVQHSG